MKKVLLFTVAILAIWQLLPGDSRVINSPDFVANNSPASEVDPSASTDKVSEDAFASDDKSSVDSIVPSPSRFAETKLPAFEENGYPQREYQVLTTPNDPYAGQNWELQIGLDDARAQPLGNYTPTVAVIDGGFALEHEDLRDVWLTNDAESGATTQEANSILNCSDSSQPLNFSCNVIDDDLNGIIDDESGATTYENQSLLNCSDQSLPIDKSCNLMDDDGNGLIDDYKGFDFASYERSVAAGEVDATSDKASHGSLVAGVVGAVNDNGVGLAGVSSQVKILPIQSLDDSGSGYSLSVADGIIYAVSRGVDVINLSLGSQSQDSYIEQAVDYATEHGVVVIAATGNDGCDCLFYPAAYKPVVAVGAADNSKDVAYFSNYGSELDVLAPGVNLYTSSWSDANQTDLYEHASGTSLAAPVVSGLMSRLVSYQPQASPLQLKALLFESADKSMLATTLNRSSQFGYGYVALDVATTRITTPLTSTQLTAFDYIRAGEAITNEYHRQEVDGSIVAYQCAEGTKPSTSIFKLSKRDKLAFTASEQEVEAAQRTGFSTTSLFDACILLPHDRPDSLRIINTARELLNTNNKNIYQ